MPPIVNKPQKKSLSLRIAEIFVVVGLAFSLLIGLPYVVIKKSEKDKVTEQSLVTNPKIIDVGIVDGCSVKHYTKNLPSEDNGSGYQRHTFYMAKCDGVTTVTEKVGGKIKHDEAIITIEKK